MDMTTLPPKTTASMHMHNMPTSSTFWAATASGSSDGGMDMSGMDMRTGDGPMCKISMLWNWYTVDACFLSEQWQITSNGMMAGSCVGVVFLVVVLEALRRGSKEYDKYLGRKFAARAAVEGARTEAAEGMIKGPEDGSNGGTSGKGGISKRYGRVWPKGMVKGQGFRPNLWQQGVRATLHMCQFAVAYFVSLEVFSIVAGADMNDVRSCSSPCTSTATSSLASWLELSSALSYSVGRPCDPGEFKFLFLEGQYRY